MLIRFLASAVALSVATFLVPGISLTAGSTQSKVIAMLCVAVVFGVVNTVVKPLFELVTAPLILITVGLFLLVINTLLMMLTSWIAGQLGIGWSVSGWTAAFWGALLVSVVSFVLHAFFGSKGRERRSSGYWRGSRKSAWRL
jgi:putative membrane protein